MLKIAIAYVATGAVFLTLDGFWLSLVGPRLYYPDLAPLLAAKVQAPPAVLFYLLYVAGLVYFAVRPGLEFGRRKAVISGAVLGLVSYGAYDLTCQAVMKTWSTRVSAADMAWGVFASTIAAVAGVAITRAVVARTGV